MNAAGNPFDTPQIRAEFPFGTAVDVWPGVRRITAPNPGLMTGPGTNTYLVGSRQVLVIDPACDAPAHLEAIKRAVAMPSPPCWSPTPTRTTPPVRGNWPAIAACRCTAAASRWPA